MDKRHHSVVAAALIPQLQYQGGDMEKDKQKLDPASVEEKYEDSAFEWTFTELTERMKEILEEDARIIVHRATFQKPISFHRMTEAGLSRRLSLESDPGAQMLDPTISLPSSMSARKFREALDRWSFDIFVLSHLTNGHAMQALAYEIFSCYGLLDVFEVSDSQFIRFIYQVEKHYKRNPYHNASHAADVLQTVNCIVSKTGFRNVMTDLEHFCLLLTALVHDIEHTGTNNNFHKNSNSEIAKLYVVSVQENHHLRVGMKMLQEYDILKRLTQESYRDFKYMLCTMILSTDMANHFLLITNMKLMMSTSPECQTRIRIRRIMMLMLHAADISNTAKPWDIHKVWISLLCQEFFTQGDKEKELKLPVSPNCDREIANLALSQIGFMQTFTRETFEVMDALIEKEIRYYGVKYFNYSPWQVCMEENIAKWNGKWKFLKYEQIQDLLSETVGPRMSIVPSILSRKDSGSKSSNTSTCCGWCQCLKCAKAKRCKQEDSDYSMA